MGVTRSREAVINNGNVNNEVTLLRINDDVFYDVRLFLQRTDLMALKLTCKAFYQQSYLQNLLTPKAIFEEINQYRKSITAFDEYAWKNSHHMRIRHYNLSILAPELRPYHLSTPFIETFHLWWFYLVATYQDVFPGRYYIIFHSTIRKYSIELKLTSLHHRRNHQMHDHEQIEEPEITEWTIEHNSSQSIFNEEIVEVPQRGDLRIALKETTSLKHNEKIFYLLLVPERYWAHLSQVIPIINDKPYNAM